MTSSARRGRVAFTAPLSVLTHTFDSTAPARSWLAIGEPHRGTVTFLANTSADWRHAALQAVHELVEAVAHRAHGVTADTLAALDLHLLAHPYDTSAYTHGHVHAANVEAALALLLGVDLAAYAQATYGRLRPRFDTPHLVGEQAVIIESIFNSIQEPLNARVRQAEPR